MAHVAKYTRAACGHMFKHYERAKDEKGDYVKFGNIDIDTSRSHLNYNLAPAHQSQGEFVKQRCSEVRMQNRKDVNVMCSWVVTAPKDLAKQDEKIFFEETYSFLSKRYGEENIISAYVHMDETTPHIHFAFVPVAKDKKRNGYKVSAKEVVHRYDLSVFHEDLSKYLEKSLGKKIGIVNEATREGNKSIEELKRKSATERLQEASTIVSEAHRASKEAHESIKALEEQKQALQRELEEVEGKLLTAREVSKIDGKKRFLSNKVKNITYNEYFNLKMTASRVETMEKERDEALKKVALVEEKEKALEIRKNEIEKERPSLQLQLEMAKLKSKILQLEKGKERLINSFPENQRQNAIDIFEERNVQNKNRGYKR